MRKLRLAGLLFSGLLFSGLVAFADDHPDFTGNWVLNAARSNFGKMPKPTSMTLKAERKGEVLHATQTTATQEGSEAVEGDWFLDGKQHPVDTKATASKMMQMSKWDGRTLHAERRSTDGTYDETIRMTLSADGKTATEKIAVKSPNGNNSSTLVWERK